MRALLFPTVLLLMSLPACQRANNDAVTTAPTNTGQTEATPTPAPTPAAMVKDGLWGGLGISLTVANPQSKFELDCAHGTIDGPLVLDRFNHFNAYGAFEPDHGGPISPTPTPAPTYQAHYTGFIAGQSMSLRIRYTSVDGPSDMSYTLTYKAQPTLHKCLLPH